MLSAGDQNQRRVKCRHWQTQADTFDTDQSEYGNGFIVAEKWKNSIHKFWKVSDRICVIQFKTKKEEEYKKFTVTDRQDTRVKIERVSSNYRIDKIDGMKTTIKKKNTDHIITVINVYAPTSERARKYQHETEKMFRDLEKVCLEVDRIKTSMKIIAGDFNAKVGKRTGDETCLGKWSRGIRNSNGSRLIDFCEQTKKTIANSCFKHPAKHITTWSQQRVNKESKTVTEVFNQIDYIIVDEKNKHH